MDQIEKELFEGLEREAAYEMAQVGKFSNEALEIWVYAKEGPTPHFHFKNDASGIEGCIQLTQAKYFIHGGYNSTLNSQQRKALVKFLRLPSEDLPGVTNWQFVLALWNSNNRRYQIPVNTSMPDYRQIEM